MLGFLAMGLTTLMIYTLVKNALLGKQLSQGDKFSGTIELIIPVTSKSELFLEAWPTHQIASGQLKVHILIDGHHPQKSKVRSSSLVTLNWCPLKAPSYLLQKISPIAIDHILLSRRLRN